MELTEMEKDSLPYKKITSHIMYKGMCMYMIQCKHTKLCIFKMLYLKSEIWGDFYYFTS